jgi:hypothetical protein
MQAVLVTTAQLDPTIADLRRLGQAILGRGKECAGQAYLHPWYFQVIIDDREMQMCARRSPG